ncbi:hypothetical protein [Methylobacterium longum]|uniref:Uncharacterized protein n=1 Tax=Methylobacterium longum TaxID=767694 RepID=A0ABT8ATX5_9HYPH|nr:hypothetical protein [Methylobacterium longum]MDN3572951.1 hypothetical protein [Methylobacterium longum]GJE14565.1 hypothetical protein FOHLNKBM_5640 [Methylobacterium longum]
MPAWRRLLCILLGTPLALGGVALLSAGGVGPAFIPAMYLIGMGGLLALSGLAPRATRNY